MATIKHVYMCPGCSTTYRFFGTALDCCISVTEWEMCDYCEGLFKTRDGADAHLIDGKCPKEIEQNEKSN
jgi:hypothetical protein